MAVMPRVESQLACVACMLMTCLSQAHPEFLEKFKKVVKSQFKIGHEDVNDLMFTGQRVKWVLDEKTEKKSHITVEQSLCVSELTEVVIPEGLKDEEKCDKDLHTAYRSLRVTPR